LADQKIKPYYETIIIGGGIVGAGILRDFALHKKDVLLIEKGDYSSQTSAGSSKMLHGGIRYLENFDFLLVFEALREKKIWLKLASHISKEQTFILPVYKDSKWPLFLMRIGLFLYDLLSLFKNKPHSVLSKEETVNSLPGIKQKGLTGAGVYSDGVIDDSKLVFDLIFDSLYHGAQAINYHEVKNVHKEGRENILNIKNNITNESIVLKCKNIIFAVGPFTDFTMNTLNIPWKNIILPSKGSHIWLKQSSLKIQKSLVIQTKDKRIIFVIPQRNAILVGTTEIALKAEDNLFNLEPSQDERDYLLESINNYFPDACISTSDIVAEFAAVRPLIKSNIPGPGKTSRHHKIYTPLPNTYVVAGGKYTTFRVMASDLTKKVFKNNNEKYDKSLSKSEFTKKSLLADIHTQKIDESMLNEIIQNEQVKSLEDLIKRRLSLYSLDQYKDKSELENLLNSKRVQSLPKTIK
jgi:glycerol-3-phosphate dehydrogenase